VLRAAELTVRYGAVTAVRGVSFSLREGEILAVLGPNGAGKTSLLRAVSGFLRHAGEATVDDAPIGDPHDAVRLRVVHSPQGRGLFRRLSVAQNIDLVANGSSRSERAASASAAAERIPELHAWWNRRVGSLSGGEQVLVALGRLIAAKPRFALVDELSLGLAPIARDRVTDELRRMRDDGVGLVVVDQHAPRAVELADDVLVLERGTPTFAGRADDADPDAIAGLALGVRR
jgi:branched-chain amino acid transport system ATP-binding protein